MRRFVGSAGLRAGWRVLIFLLVLAVSVLILVRLFPQIARVPSVITPRPALLRDGLGALVILMATWLMGVIERRPLVSYGLSGPHMLRHFAAGLAWGVAMLSLLIGALSLSGHIVFTEPALHGGSILRYALVWMLVFLLVAFAEETLFRGYLQATLARGMGFWPAALLLSLAFGLIHLRSGNEVPLGIAMAVMGGLVFSLCLKLSGSLWWGIGFHASWDWAQTFLFGTADSGYPAEGHWLSTYPIGDARWSGGTAGPEGSLFVIPVFFVAALVIALTLRKSSLLNG